MFWNNNIGPTEYWFIAIFLVIYVVYFIKITYIALKMKVSARASFLKFLPRMFALSLLIIALLEPSFGNYEEYSKTKVSNRVIYFLVDVSKSMDAQDIAPSRIEKTKNEIKKIINYFPTEKFGLIAFASEADLISPLTSDQETMKTMVTTLNTNLFENSGTNLVSALKLGLNKISTTKYNLGTSTAIVLFTDGEDFADLSENTINEIKRNRVQLILVGVGTEKGSKIVDQSGNFIKDKNEKVISTKLENDYLKTLALKTNGKYFEFNNNNSPLNELIERLQQIKGGISRSQNAANPGNKYHYPLLLAIFILCLDLLFTIRIFNF